MPFMESFENEGIHEIVIICLRKAGGNPLRETRAEHGRNIEIGIDNTCWRRIQFITVSAISTVFSPTSRYHDRVWAFLKTL